MGIIKSIALFLLLIALLTLTAISQISGLGQPSNVEVKSQITQATDKINIEQKQFCTITPYEEIQDVYSNCFYYHNYTSCVNTTGANTDCSLQQDILAYKCKTGEASVAKNETRCNPENKFVFSINQWNMEIRKQIDFSDWGPCIYSTENNCLIVTCVSNEDGAFKGQFTDCKGGKSCQKFVICDDSIKTFYKNSREDFVESDPTFFLNKLAIQEVGK